MPRLPFRTNCINWPHDDVQDGLCAMIEAERQITRRTFIRHVDRADLAHLERSLGYAPHDPGSILTMARDYHVSYHRSTLHGRRVYYFKHSAIEYVFDEEA